MVIRLIGFLHISLSLSIYLSVYLFPSFHRGFSKRLALMCALHKSETRGGGNHRPDARRR